MKMPLLFALVLAAAFSSCQRKDASLAILGTWRVQSIHPNGEASEPAEGTYLLDFRADETFSLNLDVNDCGGEYALPGSGRIQLSRLLCTRICCDSPFALRLTILLQEVEAFQIQGDTLRLEGETGAVFLERQ